jgi:hypothetical protein
MTPDVGLIIWTTVQLLLTVLLIVLIIWFIKRRRIQVSRRIQVK